MTNITKKCADDIEALFTLSNEICERVGAMLMRLEDDEEEISAKRVRDRTKAERDFYRMCRRLSNAQLDIADAMDNIEEAREIAERATR